MPRRNKLLVFALIAALLFAGCTSAPSKPAAPKDTTASPPATPVFDVHLATGETLTGTLSWSDDNLIAVGGRTVPASAVRSILKASGASGDVAAVDMASLPDGFRPLDDNTIAAYRTRATAASDTYRGSEAVLCLDQGENYLHSDGTQLYRYHALFMILKENGRGVSNVSIGFHEGRGRARMLFARVVSPEGDSTWTPLESFQVTVPPQAAQFVDTRSRILSGQVAGAAVGMLIEYAYEEELYNPEIRDFFFPGYIFQSTNPVLDSIVDIFVPSGTRLNFATPNMPAASGKPLRTSRDGYDGYRWEMRNVAPMTPEPFMPAESDVLPHLQTSLYFDWKDLMGPTGRFQTERIEVTPEIQSLADELAAGKTTDAEKVAAVYHWVQRNINYLSIKASLSSGWAGHAASETLANGYGDCTDVAVLVSSLCRALGVEAYPAIVKTNDAGTMMTDIPVPDANHAITLVYPDGTPRFIDATAQDYRYPYFRSDDHGVKAVIYMKEEILTVPIPPPQDNMRESLQHVTLFPDGSAEISERNAYTGSYEAGVRGFWRSVPPEMRGMMMQQYLQGRSPGAALEDFKLSDMEDLDTQLTMNIDYKLPSIATRMQDLYIFTLPNFAQKFPEASLDERTFDIVTQTTQEYDTSVEVALPEGYAYAGAPAPLVVNGKHLSFEGSVALSEDGRSLIVRQVFKKLTNRVPVPDYAVYRTNAAAIAAWTDLKIVLKTTASSGEETK